VHLIAPVFRRTALDNDDEVFDGHPRKRRLRYSDDARHGLCRFHATVRRGHERRNVMRQYDAIFGSGVGEHGLVGPAREAKLLDAGCVDVQHASAKPPCAGQRFSISARKASVP
jgi:hypothetical protein